MVKVSFSDSLRGPHGEIIVAFAGNGRVEDDGVDEKASSTFTVFVDSKDDVQAVYMPASDDEQLGWEDELYSATDLEHTRRLLDEAWPAILDHAVADARFVLLGWSGGAASAAASVSFLHDRGYCVHRLIIDSGVPGSVPGSDVKTAVFYSKRDKYWRGQCYVHWLQWNVDFSFGYSARHASFLNCKRVLEVLDWDEENPA